MNSVLFGAHQVIATVTVCPPTRSSPTMGYGGSRRYIEIRPARSWAPLDAADPEGDEHIAPDSPIDLFVAATVRSASPRPILGPALGQTKLQTSPPPVKELPAMLNRVSSASPIRAGRTASRPGSTWRASGDAKAIRGW